MGRGSRTGVARNAAGPTRRMARSTGDANEAPKGVRKMLLGSPADRTESPVKRVTVQTKSGAVLVNCFVPPTGSAVPTSMLPGGRELAVYVRLIPGDWLMLGAAVLKHLVIDRGSYTIAPNPKETEADRKARLARGEITFVEKLWLEDGIGKRQLPGRGALKNGQLGESEGRFALHEICARMMLPAGYLAAREDDEGGFKLFSSREEARRGAARIRSYAISQGKSIAAIERALEPGGFYETGQIDWSKLKKWNRADVQRVLDQLELEQTKGEDLQALLGPGWALSKVRDLKHDLTIAGQPIAANGNGYFKPRTPKAAKEYLSRFRQRTGETKMHADRIDKSAALWFPDPDNPEEMAAAKEFRSKVEQAGPPTERAQRDRDASDRRIATGRNSKTPERLAMAEKASSFVEANREWWQQYGRHVYGGMPAQNAGDQERTLAYMDALRLVKGSEPRKLKKGEQPSPFHPASLLVEASS